MKYRITRRILEGSQTIGYELASEDGEVRRLSKLDTLSAANRGCISNAKLNSNKDALIGIDIDLRTLPSIQLSKLNSFRNKNISDGYYGYTQDKYLCALDKIRVKAKLTGVNPLCSIVSLIDKMEGTIDAGKHISYGNGNVQVINLHDANILANIQYYKYITSLDHLLYGRTITGKLSLTGLMKNYFTSSASAFQNCTIADDSYLDISDLDTSMVTDASKMFKDCIGEVHGIESLNTQRMTDISEILLGAAQYKRGNANNKYSGLRSAFGNLLYSLKYDDCMSIGDKTKQVRLDLSGWSTHNVQNMQWAFAHTCYDIVGISDWDVSNVLNFENIFRGYRPSKAIKHTLDLSNWKINTQANTTGMFNGCVAHVKANDARIIAEISKSRTLLK